MLVSTRELLREPGPLPAFNFTTPEVCRAIVQACAQAQQPAILQLSQSESEFLGLEVADAIGSYYISQVSTPFSLHLDHQKTIGVVDWLLGHPTNFSSLMLDVEDLTFEEGTKLLSKTRQRLPQAICLEGNFDPGQNLFDFLNGSQVDIVAPEKANFVETEVLAKLAKESPVPVAMHGGSTKSQAEVRTLVKAGVKKFHFNTELRQAWSQALRQAFRARPQEIKPYLLLKEAEQAVYQVVLEKISWLKGT